MKSISSFCYENLKNENMKSISFCLEKPTEQRLAKVGGVSNGCLASSHLSKHFSSRNT